MKDNLYDNNFYKDRDAETNYSAETILPILTKRYKINSMVDFGCGVGTWLHTMKQINPECKTVLGMDGDYVNRDYLMIDKSEFRPTDLSKSITLDKKFDLAISLEVAEHLPESRAESFVKDICAVSDLVLFSAATIGQGGVGHVNEQRLSYWKSIFDKNNYELYDIIRPLIWNDKKILFWYRQNCVVFINRNNATLFDEKPPATCVDIIHPELFEQKDKTLKRILSKPIIKRMIAMKNALRKRNKADN